MYWLCIQNNQYQYAYDFFKSVNKIMEITAQNIILRQCGCTEFTSKPK